MFETLSEMNHESSIRESAPRRVAVLVDNLCVNDNRVIKSSEALKTFGYDVRVFARAGRKGPYSETVNGVHYERKIVPTLKYVGGIADLLNSLWFLCLHMPGNAFWKLHLICQIVLTGAIYGLKRILDFVNRKRKNRTKARNQRNRKNKRRRERLVKKIQQRFGTRLAHIILTVNRPVKFSARRASRGLKLLAIFVAGILMLPVLLLVGLIFAPFIAVVAFEKFLTETFAKQKGNVATNKVSALTKQKAQPKKKPRIHSRLLRWLLDSDSDYYYANKMKLRSVRVYKAIRDDVIAYQPDIIHAHDLVNLPIGAFLKKDLNIPMIYDSHELETERDKPEPKSAKQAVRKIEKKFILHANHVITVSDGLADIIGEKYCIKRPSVVMNAPSFSQSLAAAKRVREDKNIPHDAPLGLYVGGLKPRRGLPFYLEAVAKLEGVHFVAVGPRTAKAEETMLEMVNNIGIADRFHLAGPIEPEYLLDYIKGCDFSIMPTQNIGLSYIHALPNKFFESLLAGIPIIVGREIIEMATIVEEHGFGVLTQQDDPDRIAEAIESVLTDGPNIKARINSSTIPRTLSWDNQAKSLSVIYATLMEESAPTEVESFMRQPAPTW